MIKVDGNVASGFENVKARFESEMNTLKEEHAQLCVYVGDEQVVDLWASSNGDAFHADSLVNVFSSGKSLESIAVASLFSKGLIQYDDKIAEYWPEFAQSGKADLTVADLMRHEAGLSAFNTSIEPTDLHVANIKQNKVGAIIEQHPLHYSDPATSKREYHAVTRGWIVNELFRRVDPAGRTIGEYLNEEIRSAHNMNCMVGVPESELGSVTPVKPIGFGYHFRESFKPKSAGRGVKDNIFQLSAKLLPLVPRMRKQARGSNPPPFIGMKDVDIFNNDTVRKGETPSANAHCSARGLARLAAFMANGGELGGTELISSSAWQALHAKPISRSMMFSTTFTQGGVAAFGMETTMGRMERALNVGREGFYGWMGLGGSVFQWHPEKKIGFSFVPTSLHILDLVNERAKVYQKEILNILG